jgi:hypothetical protein
MEAMMTMGFRRILFVAALGAIGCGSAARAQFALYGTAGAERLKAVTCTDPKNVCASNDGVVRPYGGTVGAFYDFRTYGPVRLGADLRATFLNSNKSAYAYQGGVDVIRHYALLGGVRGTFKTPFKVLRPYIQASAGWGRTDATAAPLAPAYALNYQNFTQVQGFAGLDLAVFQNVDFRVIEFGAGEMFGPSSHSIQSIGIGIVFHTSRE